MTPVRIIVVGAGFIAHQHLLAYRSVSCRFPHVVIGIVDPALDRAQALAHEFGIPHVFDSIQDALRIPADAFDICSPTRDHAAHALAALEVGRHVFIEKPIALTVEDADEIVARSSASSLVVMVGHSARFGAVGRQLHTVKCRGDLGTIGVVEMATWHGYFWEGGWRAWQIDPSRSGGHIVHNGIHDIDLACWMLDGPPIEVYATGTRIASPALAIPDAFHVIMSWEHGACASVVLSYSAIPAGLGARFVCVTGTQGEAVYQSPGDEIVWRGGGGELSVLDGADAFEHEIAHWLDCILRSRTPLITPRQARAALATAVAAEASLAQNRAVGVAQSESLRQ